MAGGRELVAASRLSAWRAGEVVALLTNVWPRDH